MEYNVIKLKHLTPCHFGSGNENYFFSASQLHSDTLSSALAAIKANRGDTDDLHAFLNSFRISSAFPFIDEQYFLPRMKGKLPVQSNNSKELKKIKYIESTLWNQLISGREITFENHTLRNGFLFKQSNCDEASVYCAQVNQRARISRDGSAPTEPFFFEWTYYNPQGGLYCITDAHGKLFNEIVVLFQILGEIGIGTDKSIGGGKFEVETTTINIQDVHNPNAQMVLSLFIPGKEEVEKMNLTESRYDLIHRGGYMNGSSQSQLRHFKKNSVYMFDIGSVFATKDLLNGCTVNLQPHLSSFESHPVYRSGKAITIPILTSNTANTDE